MDPRVEPAADRQKGWINFAGTRPRVSRVICLIASAAATVVPACAKPALHADRRIRKGALERPFRPDLSLTLQLSC